MILHILLLFVIQICYCSANCDCASEISFPLYAVILNAITIAILFLSTVALGAMVCRQRQRKGSELAIFGNDRHVSISKYERQLSGNSQGSTRDSMNSSLLNTRENRDMCIIEDVTETDACHVMQKKKVHKQLKVPIFPQMHEEQMNAICQAVLLKHRMKESTSLSELDKIVNDAKKQDKVNSFDVSASTPELDVYDVLPSPLPIKKLPVFEPTSIESKLQQEIIARFNKDDAMSNVSDDELKLNVDVIEIMPKDSEDEVTPEGHNISSPKTNLAEINSKLIHEEIKAKQAENKLKDTILTKSSIDEIKLNVNLDKKKLQVNSEETVRDGLEDEKYIQDKIYDHPPPPRPHNHLYDFPPLPVLFNDIYEIPPSPGRRNLIVSYGNDSGYLIPLSDSEALPDEPQYTNAKSMTDLDKMCPLSKEDN